MYNAFSDPTKRHLAILQYFRRLKVNIYVLDVRSQGKTDSPYTIGHHIYPDQRSPESCPDGFIGTIFLVYNGTHFDYLSWCPPKQKNVGKLRALSIFPLSCYPDILREMWCSLQSYDPHIHQ